MLEQVPLDHVDYHQHAQLHVVLRERRTARALDSIYSASACKTPRVLSLAERKAFIGLICSHIVKPQSGKPWLGCDSRAAQGSQLKRRRSNRRS